MQPRCTISLAGIVLPLAVQAGLKAGTTTVVVPGISSAVAPKLLPGPATSCRVFASNDTLTVFAEIYDNSSSRPPRQIDAVSTMLSEGGQDVFRAVETTDNPAVARGNIPSVAGETLSQSDRQD